MTTGNGSRLKCQSCGSEAVVVKSQEPQLSCCGQPVEVIFTPPAGNRS